MRKISLKQKTFLIGTLPFLFFFGMALIYPINQNYQSYIDARSLKNKMIVLEAASAVVHESQKERGMSAGYLGGGIKKASLEKQRKVNNQKINYFKSVLRTSVFTQEYRAELLKSIKSLKKTRIFVDQKSETLDFILKSYTNSIKSLLDVQIVIGNQTRISRVSTEVRSLRIMEDIKEAGGKLRANMTSILSKNEAISEKKITQISELKAGVDVGLKSSGLSLDKQSREYMVDFQTSKSWKNVNETFYIILTKSSEGKYNLNSEQFFSEITEALDIIGDMINHEKQLIKNEIQHVYDQSWKNLLYISGLIGLLTLGVFYFITFATKVLSQKLTQIIDQLDSNSDDLASLSIKIADSSNSLSEAGTEAATSLQQTVSSIDEISSMVQRNADSAGNSTLVSSKSNQAAIKGKEMIEDMILSITHIAESNEEIASEMKNNNEEISKIVDVISEIGEKTKVINDIVFQTKLLSFNASVEAARAGEHGKGFAVVAEEVGNLAAMSGKAALEITEMLDSSIKEVKEIVQNSQNKVEHLMNDSRNKVNLGKETAESCGCQLDEILKNVSSVNEMIREIATASTEQSTGVQEVTKAIQQLDQATFQNNSIAQESAVMAEQLKQQTKELNDSIFSLTTVVQGYSENQFNYFNDQSKKLGEVVELDKVRPIKPLINESVKKVVGLDTDIPDADDPRFEDL